MTVTHPTIYNAGKMSEFVPAFEVRSPLTGYSSATPPSSNPYY